MRNPGTGHKRTKKTAKKKRVAVTGVKSRTRVGTAGSNAHFSETYRRTRRSPASGITRRTVSKKGPGGRAAMQTGKAQTTKGRNSDAKRAARFPGKRVSARGRTYTETRRNRSDARPVSSKRKL